MIEFEIVNKKEIEVPNIKKEVIVEVSPGGYGSGGIRGSLLLRIDGIVVFNISPKGIWSVNDKALGRLRECVCYE